MNKFLLPALFGGMILGGALNLSATSWDGSHDGDDEKEDECITEFKSEKKWEDGLKLAASGGTISYSGTFDLTADGFNPSTMTILSGKAEFKFRDDSSSSSDGSETYSIDLGSSSVSPSWSNSYSFTIDSSNISLLTDLQADGKLAYTVKALTGDFFLKSAKLTISADICPEPPQFTTTSEHDDDEEEGGAGNCQTNKVPDSASALALMSLALAGLAGMKRWTAVAR